MSKQVRYGGIFAPPLDADKLSHYEELASSADEQVGRYMRELINMVRVFQETPASSLKGTPHKSGRGVIVPLEEDEKERIWDVVPYKEELDMISQVFDRIDPVAQKELRDAAFHLLWFGRKLEMDREPITNDQL